MDEQQSLDRLSRDELIALARAQRDELESLRVQHEKGIRITFGGKDVAKGIARKVQPRTSRHLAQYSVGSEDEQARNLVIEGENLQAMATLYRDRGQVDLILTDPPYNTGKGFRYNDKWDEDPNDPDLGPEVSLEDAGRHTKWLHFMWPRLKVMLDMLKPEGVLAICIDDRELFRLGQVLDELFGEENRLAVINWQKIAAPKNDKTHVAASTEYVLVYAKDADLAKTMPLPRAENSFSRYKNPDNDPKGRWREHDLSARTPSPPNTYGIQSPFEGRIHYPPGQYAWRFPRRRIKSWLEEWGVQYVDRDIHDGKAPALLVKDGTAGELATDGRPGSRIGSVPQPAAETAKARIAQDNWPFVWFGLEGDGGPRVKRYMNEIRKGVVPTTYWARDEYEFPLDLDSISWDWEQSGLSQTGYKELAAIVGKNHGFETVKPLQLFTKIIQLWCPPDGLVMDPFAGSGTTGHAVLAMNNESGSSRRFILMEQGRPDRGDPYAKSLLANRLRRVVTGDWAAGPQPPAPGGYSFLQLQKEVDARALLEMERDEMTVGDGRGWRD